jgi:hypothetical protein
MQQAIEQKQYKILMLKLRKTVQNTGNENKQ